MRKHLQFHECNSTVELNVCNKLSKQGKIMGSELSRYCYTYSSAHKKVFNRAQTLELWQNNFTVLQKGVY